MKQQPDQDEPRETQIREAFRDFARSQGWDVSTRDGRDDYFEERTFYAWLGYKAASELGATR